MKNSNYCTTSRLYSDSNLASKQKQQLILGEASGGTSSSSRSSSSVAVTFLQLSTPGLAFILGLPLLLLLLLLLRF